MDYNTKVNLEQIYSLSHSRETDESKKVLQKRIKAARYQINKFRSCQERAKNQGKAYTSKVYGELVNEIEFFLSIATGEENEKK